MNLSPDSKFGERSRFAILYSPLAVLKNDRFAIIIWELYRAGTCPSAEAPSFLFYGLHLKKTQSQTPNIIPIITDFRSSIMTPFFQVKGLDNQQELEDYSHSIEMSIGILPKK